MFIPSALLLSRDADVVRVVRKTLDGLNISLEVVTGSEQANRFIVNQKFDAILVDTDDVQDGVAVLGSLRKGKSNRAAIAFAIVNGITSVKTAYELGANFVLAKPLPADRATRCFRAAYGLILRERRRYHRHKVDAEAQLQTASGYLQVQVHDVSEGGLSLGVSSQPNPEGSMTLLFKLPGMNDGIEARGELLWSRESGRAGFKLRAMRPEHRNLFDDWLRQLTQEEFREAAPEKTISRR